MSLKVSVVIPTYNRCRDLVDCIGSLLAMEGPQPEIIVVDSGSQDGTAELRRSHPIRLVSIQEKSRIRARNLGISMAQGDIVAFLDDDTTVDKSWLISLLQPYADRGVGGVGGRVIPHGESRHYHRKIQHSATGRVSKDGLVLGNFDMPSEALFVDHLPGCNMSIRREVLGKVGGFDEHFQGNCFRDDTDLCLRVREIGYRLIYQPRALVWHKYKGRSIDAKWTYWYVRNNTYFYFKSIFPRARMLLPLFLYRQAFPPKDYVEKSGIRIGLSPWAILLATKGLVEGISLHVLHQNRSR